MNNKKKLIICTIIFFLICLLSAQEILCTTIRVNIGGEQWIDNQGNKWLADQRYTSGSFGYLGISKTVNTNNTINNTDKEYIYKSERSNLFGYRFDVQNGNYNIILHFVEFTHKRNKKRVTNIIIEKELVIENLDIHGKVGNNHPLALTINTKTMNIPILDGRIDIKLKHKIGKTTLSAIEIIPIIDESSLIKIIPEKLNFGKLKNSIPLSIKNMGHTPVNCSFDQEKLTLFIIPKKTSQIKIAPNSTISIPIKLKRNGLKSGIHQDSLILIATNFKQTIPISYTIIGEPILTIKNKIIDFKDKFISKPIIIINNGGSELNWSINSKNTPQWVQRIYPLKGNLDIAEQALVNITVNRHNISKGKQTFSLPIISNNGNKNIILKISTPIKTTSHFYVKSNAVGKNDGSSWSDAFSSITQAVSIAKQNNSTTQFEIWVAEGKYYEHNIYLHSGIELYGGFQGNETYRTERQNVWSHPTIIDCQKRGRCIECEHKTIIDGFVIQNGRDWGEGDGKGAAILACDADIKISNNLIRNNTDSWAGAIFIDGFKFSKNVKGFSPIIENNLIIDNYSNLCAAAIEMWGSEAIVRNNTIVNNDGYGLEINDRKGPLSAVVYGNFYNNIITNNGRKGPGDVWNEARKSTNYSFVGNKWKTTGRWPPYDFGTGNIFADESKQKAGFNNYKNNAFRLQSDSPCIDVGNPNSNRDIDNSNADIGAFPFNKNKTTIELSSTAIDFQVSKKIQYLTINAYGGNGVEWQIVKKPELKNIFNITPQKGFLKNGDVEKLKITLNRKKQHHGLHKEFISVITPDQSVEKEIFFNINYTQSELKAYPLSIKFNAHYKNKTVQKKQIKIVNTGFKSLQWQSKTKFKTNWLELKEITQNNKDFIEISINTFNLNIGDYYEEILITSNNSINKELIIPINIEIIPPKFFIKIEAEDNSCKYPDHWKKVTLNGELHIQALSNFLLIPNDSSRIDYEFNVPDGVEQVYVFAEVINNKSYNNDSYWFQINDIGHPCKWDYISPKQETAIHSWVYDIHRDSKHLFVTIPGKKNKLTIYTKESGGYINWFVVTNDPKVNLNNY